MKNVHKAEILGVCIIRACWHVENNLSLTKMKVYFHLTDDQLKLVKSMYNGLTSDEMMQRCMK